MRYRGELLCNRQGFSLLELMIVTSIFGIILAGVYGILMSTQSTYAVGTASASLNLQARRTVDRIAEELRDAGVETLFPSPTLPFGSDDLTFQKNVGYQAGAIVWGDVNRVALWEPASPALALWTDLGGANEKSAFLTLWVREYAEGEVANGLDDNGNGLVDEKGISFALDGNTLTIRLTLERIGEDDQVYTASVDTSIRLRN